MNGVKAGELFVELGVTKEGGLYKALASVKNNLGSVADAGLAAKVAIVGMFYGMERMTMSAAQWGNHLNRFALLTGRSNQEIQKWGMLAVDAGGKAEDMQQAFLGAQNIQAQILSGNTQAIGPMEQIIQELKAHGQAVDTLRLMRDPMYMMKKMMAFSKMTATGPMAGYANMLMQQLGFSPDMIADWRSKSFNLKNLNKESPYTLSDRTQQSLSRFVGQWHKMEVMIEKSFAGFTSKHGQQIITDMQKIVVSLISLAGALDNFATKTKLFDLITTFIQGLADAFNLFSGATNSASKEIGKTFGAHGFSGGLESLWSDVKKNYNPNYVPNAHATNVTNHFHGITDHKALAKEVHKTVKDAHSDLIRHTAAQSNYHPVRQ